MINRKRLIQERAAECSRRTKKYYVLLSSIETQTSLFSVPCANLHYINGRVDIKRNVKSDDFIESFKHINDIVHI